MMVIKTTNILEVADIVSGSTPKGVDKFNASDGDIPFFRVGDMNSAGNEIWMNNAAINLSLENTKKLKLKICEKGTVIFPKRGGAIFTNKKRILARSAAFDLNTMGLCPKDNIDSNFFYYWFNSLDLGTLANGSSVPQLNNNQISPLKIPLPPLLQQKKIAAILDAADAYRQKTKALITKYDELTQSLFLDMFGDPFKGDVSPLKENLRITGGYAFKSKDFVKSGVPLIKIGTVNKGYFDLDRFSFLPKAFINTHEKWVVLPGDILISLTGTVGKNDYGNVEVATNEFKLYMLNQRVAKLEPSNNTYLKEFLFGLFSNNKTKKELTKISRGVRQANISNRDIENLEMITPTKSQQQAYISAVKNVESQKIKAQASLIKAEDLFNSLLQKAFKGELSN